MYRIIRGIIKSYVNNNNYDRALSEKRKYIFRNQYNKHAPKTTPTTTEN